VGTGTSILRVEDGQATRLGGTALGGGTVLGLGVALTGCESYEELCALFRVPPAVLPEVRASSGVLGEARAAGLEGIPLAGVAGDQQAALFGQGCFAPGALKCTYGTGCFVLLNTGGVVASSEHGLLSTVAWQRAGETTYALEGSVFAGGSTVQWLRDGLGLIDHAGDVEALAGRVEDAGGVVFVPAFTGLGAPHWDAYARGALLGITRGTRAAHIARAALDAIAYQVADVVEALEEDAGLETAVLRVDGGAARNDLLLQTQADLLGRPIVRPALAETTALGAARLAGLAVGVWPDLRALQAPARGERRFEPTLETAEIAAPRRRWRDAVGRSRAWAPAGDA
ncbi:MAG: FGGY family carbohydrate kinase, partial [Planctomycetota bacterium]